MPNPARTRRPVPRVLAVVLVSIAGLVAGLPAQPDERPAPAGEVRRAERERAEREFQALERELYAKHRGRLAGTGGRLDRIERAHIEQGREMVKRWTAFLKKHGRDHALAFRAQNYLVQGHHLANQTEDALQLLARMEAEAETIDEIVSVAMGFFHVRDSMDAGAQVLDRFLARRKDPEVIAAATLEKRNFMEGRTRAIRKAKRLELARRVAQAYPKTKAGQRAALLVRAGQLAPGQRPLAMNACRDVQGKPIALADYRGKALLLHFWGATIGESVRELRTVVEVYRTLHERGFEVLSVSLDRDRKVAEATARHHGMTWRHHCDGRGWGSEVAVLYQVDTLPWSILIGADGRVAAINPHPDKLMEQVRRALPKPPGETPRKAPDTPRHSDPR